MQQPWVEEVLLHRGADKNQFFFFTWAADRPADGYEDCDLNVSICFKTSIFHFLYLYNIKNVLTTENSDERYCDFSMTTWIVNVIFLYQWFYVVKWPQLSRSVRDVGKSWSWVNKLNRSNVNSPVESNRNYKPIKKK